MYGDDLFNPVWTQGSLDAISVIVGPVGWFCMIIISLGGFFMVMLPIIRQVINGIVVSAPNFCERIDQAHRDKLGYGNFKSMKDNAVYQNQIVQVVGSGMTIVLSLFPNFKALSDFDKGVTDPKGFMMKGMAMMCVYVFMGVLVYRGYLAKIANKFSDGAIYVMDLALNNVDPIGLVQGLSDKFKGPEFSTAEATDIFGKNVRDTSKKMYSAVKTKYTSMTADNVAVISNEIEALAVARLTEIRQFSESKDYKLTVEARISGFDPPVNPNAEWPTPAHDGDKHVDVFQFKFPIEGTLTVGTPGGAGADHMLVTLKFRELAKKGDTVYNVTNTATFCTNDVVDHDGKAEWRLPKDMNKAGIVLSGKITVNGKVSIDTPKKTQDGEPFYTAVFDCSVEEFLNASGNSSGLTYRDAEGKQHAIKSVKFSSSVGTGSAEYTPSDGSKYNPWKHGETPTFKQESSGGEGDGSGQDKEPEREDVTE